MDDNSAFVATVRSTSWRRRSRIALLATALTFAVGSLGSCGIAGGSESSLTSGAPASAGEVGGALQVDGTAITMGAFAQYNDAAMTAIPHSFSMGQMFAHASR